MNINAEKYLGKLVIARTAQGEFKFIGKCISICDAPTIGINLRDGERAHWRVDMVEVVDLPKEAIDALLEPSERGSVPTCNYNEVGYGQDFYCMFSKDDTTHVHRPSSPASAKADERRKMQFGDSKGWHYEEEACPKDGCTPWTQEPAQPTDPHNEWRKSIGNGDAFEGHSKVEPAQPKGTCQYSSRPHTKDDCFNSSNHFSWTWQPLPPESAKQEIVIDESERLILRSLIQKAQGFNHAIAWKNPAVIALVEKIMPSTYSTTQSVEPESVREEPQPRKLSWADETVMMINKLTPLIVGKAFDPDWFLLYQRLREFEQGAAVPVSEGVTLMPDCSNCHRPSAKGDPCVWCLRLRELTDAIRWALGETDYFAGPSRIDGPFWWRQELRKRAGLQSISPKASVV